MFFPYKTSILYFIPVQYDYDDIKFIVKIRKETEEKLNISALKKKVLNNEYKKKEYPLVLIGPYTQTDKVFNNLHLGFVDKRSS